LTVDAHVVKLRLDKILASLELLRMTAKASKDEFLGDQVLQRATERSLQIAAQCVIDISTHIVAHNHWGAPESYKDSVVTISEHGMISKDLASRLVELVKLRNVIIHLYLDADPRIVYESARQSIQDLREFVSSIRKTLEPV
jgi:uncharacterized protein YutE (UPF0331/DUF86 family)